MKPKNIYTVPFSFLLLSAVLLGAMPREDAVPIEGITQKMEPKPAVTVGMTNTMKFTPDTVRIEAGETVRWENSSLLVHSVTGDPSQSTVEGSAELPDDAEPFHSGMMDPDQTFSHTFNIPGIYQYFCLPHEGPKMYGWVVVE